MENKNVNENLEDVNEEIEDNTEVEEAKDDSTEDTLAKKEEECEKYLDMLKRTTAEYENFRKRTQKEKETLFDEGFRTAIEKIVPILDNFERALEHSNDEGSFKEGIEMILKMFKDTLEKEGVEEIPSLGEKFDPDVHNAVMHIEDEAFGQNEVVEVLLKGYKYKEKVIRHSMVKVAN